MFFVPLSNKITYVGYGVYVMGSLSCAICGHLFPLTTSPQDYNSCENCGAKHCPYQSVVTNNYKRGRDQSDAHNSHDKTMPLTTKITSTTSTTSNSRGSNNVYSESALTTLHSTLQFSRSEINGAKRRVRSLLGQHTFHESETHLPSTAQKAAKATTSVLTNKYTKKEGNITEHVVDSTANSVASNVTEKMIDTHKKKNSKKTEGDKQLKGHEETKQSTFPTTADASPSEKFTSTLKRAKVGTIAVDHRVIEEAFCENCHTHRPCWTFSRQTRSADEGQTIFFQCTKCLSEWQQNS